MAGIYLSIRKQALTALPLLGLGTICLVLAGPIGAKLNELTLDKGKITLKFEATKTEPGSAPNFQALKTSALRAMGRDSGSPELLRDLEHQSLEVLNPFFANLQALAFVPILGLQSFKPGDVVDTARGYSLIERQESAFPYLKVSAIPTTIPDVSFDVDSMGGSRYSVRVSCQNATISQAPINAFTKNFKGDPALLLATNTQIVSAILRCGSFHIHADAPIGGGLGTTVGSRNVGAQLITIQAVAERPSS